MTPVIMNKNIQRGKYLRECEQGMFTEEAVHFAKKADEERELRLMLREPKNWLSTYFSFAHEKDEIKEFMCSLSTHLRQEGYDVADLDNFVEGLK